MFREMIRDNFDLVEKELQKRGIGADLGEKPAYSVEELAKVLGVSVHTIRRRITAKIIPTVPGINPTRIPASYLARMISKT